VLCSSCNDRNIGHIGNIY